MADTSFGYVFPAIRGIQSGREYFVSMCPLRTLPKLFLFNEEELVPELRAQRTLNKARLPEMVRYVVNNPSDYVFSAITASVDGDVTFEPMEAHGPGMSLGRLTVDMNSRFIINDGQHRRAAIEQAMLENPDLADETIAVVFFIDRGLQRSQQMFADLNRHAVRPSKSIGVLYDQRDERARIARKIAFQTSAFRDLVDMERSTLSPRARRLFTLSSLYFATNALLQGLLDLDSDSATTTAARYWEAVGGPFPEWDAVRAGRITAGDVRRDFIHSHAITLQALGRVGNALLRGDPERDDFEAVLKPLSELDWSRSNGDMWEGRALVNGKVSKAGQHVTLTTNALKNWLGLPLEPDEQRLEDAFTSAGGDRT